MRENNKTGIVIIIGILLVGITAAVILLGRGSEPEEVVNQPEVIEEVAVEETEIPATVSVQEPEATQAEAAAEQVIPTAKAGLEASDPASVSLANGNIQLVEAFAFW